MGWARATCWTGGCSWRITSRAFCVRNKCSVWVSRKTRQELSPHLSLLLKGIGQDPNIFVSQKLEVWAASLSPYRSVSRAALLCLLFFFWECCFLSFRIVGLSKKKVLEIWIIILMTSESMGQKKFYVCTWFGAEYNADLVMKVEVLYSKDHQKPSFLLGFCTDKDLIMSVKWCLLVSYFRIIITTMSLMLLGYQILFGAFSSHLVLPNPYNSHFWVKKVTFMNVRWLLQSTVFAMMKLSLNLEPFFSVSYVLTSVLSSRKKNVLIRFYGERLKAFWISQILKSWV